ncbi:MAG TPA: hypothetical protein VHG35_09565 [Gemmatimonadales bacterium]|nr:hypothetical protein [Gemmatimonadales bacterium]
MALSEIEKLERRYAENPQGLTFAPLAEVHRKNGETQRALDLLKLGLAIHPDYIPASIVLGRCHLDLGDVQAAEMAFLHVLALDGENVIALKALADISERLLRFDDAERWLQTLLSVDRSNDEAREQLQRVETSRRQAEVGSAAQPASPPEPAILAEPEVASSAGSTAGKPAAAPMAGHPAGVEAASPGDARAAGEVEPVTGFEPPVAEPAVGWVAQSSQATDTRQESVGELEPGTLGDPLHELAGMELEKPAGMEIEEPVLYDELVEPLDGLVGREVDTPAEPADEFRVETSEDIVLRSSGGSEFQVPDASQELFAHGAFAERPRLQDDKAVGGWSSAAPEPTSETVPQPASEMLPEPVPYALPEPAPEPVSEERVEAAPEVLAEARPEAGHAEAGHTEAGHTDERERASEDGAPSGSAPTLLEPAAEVVEPDPAAHELRPLQSAEVVAPEPAPAAEAPAQVPKRAYAAGETGGRPVAQLLKNILSARPPAHSAPAPVRQVQSPSGSGAPTRPAADALSLSSVFGEEAPAAPPAMPTASQGAGVSFDDFFGSPGTTPASRTPRAPDPKNDDLDQFHAWLQNLKR